MADGVCASPVSAAAAAAERANRGANPDERRLGWNVRRTRGVAAVQRGGGAHLDAAQRRRRLGAKEGGMHLVPDAKPELRGRRSLAPVLADAHFLEDGGQLRVCGQSAGQRGRDLHPRPRIRASALPACRRLGGRVAHRLARALARARRRQRWDARFVTRLQPLAARHRPQPRLAPAPRTKAMRIRARWAGKRAREGRRRTASLPGPAPPAAASAAGAPPPERDPSPRTAALA